MPAHFLQAGIGLHRGVQGQRRHNHAAAFDLRRHHFIDALMQGIVKMFWPQIARHAFQRAVVHQDRAKQGLLDFDVVRDVPVDFLFHCSLFVWPGRGTGYSKALHAR